MKISTTTTIAVCFSFAHPISSKPQAKVEKAEILSELETLFNTSSLRGHGIRAEERSYCDPARGINEISRDDFLAQFQPCGHYQALCPDLEVVLANTDYPGNGPGDISRGQAYVVQFDIGVNQIVWNRSNGVHFTSTSIASPAIPEQCLEVVVEAFDDWGRFDNSSTMDGLSQGNDNIEDRVVKGGCLGKCGKGCEIMGGGDAKDCLKHDVCVMYRSLILNEDATGFCRDPDCGDEAAQTIMSCREDGGFWWDTDVICNQSDFDSNENFYVDYSSATLMFDEGQEACYDFMGWDAGQGLPPRNRISN